MSVSVDFEVGVVTTNVCDDYLVALPFYLFFAERQNIGAIGIPDRARGSVAVVNRFIYADANLIEVVHLSTVFQ